ncbi:MAG TPA: dTMP kinase [Candidatus Acidoferrum sp.]|nr:dTMP kinase [Candidatus Acidoferrum sp.]
MSKPSKGALIVLEGGDGSGKTTQARVLSSALRREGYKVKPTAEPSRSAAGRLIRRKILHGKKVSPEVEALLFAADRFLHIESEILPAVADGKIVVCDRYMFASFAYQGAQGVDLQWLREINRSAVKPDLALYLDVPAETGMRRIKRKKSVLEELDLQRRVRDEYLKLVEARELTLVDATQSITKVSENIMELVMRRLRELGI